jgi:hypothetical protein
MAEMPIAQVSQLLVQINRDPKKGNAPKLKDFLIYGDKDKSKIFPAAAAFVCLQLKREGIIPTEMLGIWQSIVEAAKRNTKEPETRALKSDCDNVWIFAPTIGEGKVHGVMLVKNFVRGKLTVTDIDRELSTFDVEIPIRQDFCYIEECSFKLAKVRQF